MPVSVAVLVGRDPAHRYSLHRGYTDAVWAVGGVPHVLTPPPAAAGGSGIDALLETVAAMDVVIVSGGGDVDPTAYGQAPAADLMDVDTDRDAAELAVVRAARVQGQPILGICRGIQLLAVAGGGSLHQHVPGHWEEERQHEPVHPISADPGSAALAALGGADVVNSIHHQAVADPGPALRATAWSPDGLIEAVEAPGVLGVQWHPERLMASDARHLAPFRWLVTGRVPA